MTIRIVRAGVQATLQGRPRRGARWLAAPAAGPADPLSMALANRLVGNCPDATAVEITLGGFEARIEADIAIGLTGAEGVASLDGEPVAFHQTLHARAGSALSIDPPRHGMRTYLAIASGLAAQEAFGSPSTYSPARWGGHQGRALLPGDVLRVQGASTMPPAIETPARHRPAIGPAFALRACASAETALLAPGSKAALFEQSFVVSARIDRMGARLKGARLDLASDGRMASGAVYPGVIQCPEDGAPIVLLCDAQTTGGYPRIASVARADRHLLGQLRPGARVRLLNRTRDEAINDLREKSAYLVEWLPEFRM
ncbi:MAG: biotin-dependent carboxyltransferase family protein [Pseudomonadota bacterium]